MDRAYIEWVRVEGFRCIKSADLHLTPLHALIGPNDSGKSSILRAIEESQGTTWWDSAGSGWVAGAIKSRRSGGFGLEKGLGQGTSRYPALDGTSDRPWNWIVPLVSPRAVVRLDPDELRKPVELFVASEKPWFTNEKGLGLAGLYDALLGRDRLAFTAIEDRFRALFPTAATLRLDNASNSLKALGLTLTSGAKIGPDEMSEGMLYWLAFAILEHLAPQAILLIEEPENGLHPARIAEVMGVLREVSQRTQIILATHSPLVINALQPDEVTIVTRTPERGTICTPMTATKHFQTRSQVYALGELWLSYADGELERELVGAAEASPEEK